MKKIYKNKKNLEQFIHPLSQVELRCYRKVGEPTQTTKRLILSIVILNDYKMAVNKIRPYQVLKSKICLYTESHKFPASIRVWNALI